MIVTETITIDEREFTRTYSDSKLRIRRLDNNAVYDEAVDPVNAGREYEETDEPIYEPELTDSEALDVILGRDS